MISLCYLGAAVIYSIYAALPFLSIPAKYHYPLGMTLSALAGLCWVTISRNVNSNQISLYGAYFDAILTLLFLFVPIWYTGYNFSAKQSLGVIFIFIGMLLTKI